MTQTTDTEPDRPQEGQELSIRPPWTFKRVRMAGIWFVIFALIPIGMWQTGMSPQRLATSLGQVWNLVQRMFPPSFQDWDRYTAVLLDTVMMVVAGTALALVLTVPISILAARNTTTGRVGYAVSRGIIVLTRAVPSLIFALIFVRAMGIGVLAGVLAMGVNSIGMLGKFYADAIEEVDPGPVEALRASGASKLQVFVGGVFPQIASNWASLLLYRLDINVRRAVIFGYVGAGGIGLELQRVLGQLAYRRAFAVVLVIFALIVVAEQLSSMVRRLLLGAEAQRGSNPFTLRNRLSARYRQWSSSRTDDARDEVRPVREGGPIRPPWDTNRVAKWVTGTAAVALVVMSFQVLEIRPARIVAGVLGLADFAALMVPPDFTTNWHQVTGGLLETFWIAITATCLGVVLSLPLGVLGARNAAPSYWVHRTARTVMLVERGIPDLILAVLFVVAVGLGPLAGVMALTVGSFGLTGKLIADAIEDMNLDVANEGLAATGASWLQRTVSGTIPQAMPAIVGVSLFTLDTNIRSASVLGIVGAGGIGVILNGTITTRQFDRTLAIILTIFAAVYLIERFAGWVRKEIADESE